MRPGPSTRRSGALAAVLLGAGALAIAQPPALAAAGVTAPGGAGHDGERGFPLIQSYVSAAEDAGSQNFAIAGDPRGYLYVANIGGVLVYDGAWWQLVPIGAQKSAFALASDEAGRIAVGGLDDMGYLEADGGGSLRFVSLAPRLPPAMRPVGQVLQITPIPGGFLFNLARGLVIWDGAAFATVTAFSGARPHAHIDQVGNAVYAWLKAAGLMRLAGRALVPVPGGERFRDRRVDAILPADDGLLVSVRGEGLFHLAADRGGSIARRSLSAPGGGRSIASRPRSRRTRRDGRRRIESSPPGGWPTAAWRWDRCWAACC
jgi:hypothetical protein